MSSSSASVLRHPSVLMDANPEGWGGGTRVHKHGWFQRRAPGPQQHPAPMNQTLHASLQPAGGATQPGAKRAAFLPESVLEAGGGGLRVRDRAGWRLALLGGHTCGAEHQRLEDVRQGDDALDVGVLVHHHQPVHLPTHVLVRKQLHSPI